MYDSEIKINILNNEIYLDHRCWHCNDYPWKKPEEIERDENGNCKYCGGRKFITSDIGDEILLFIKRHKNKPEE